MGRYGLAELPAPPANVVGLMTHLATADADQAFAAEQVERFRAATERYAHLTRHVANSAAALRLPEARFDAARCGITLYGLSPSGEAPAADGLEPALLWQSHLAQVKRLEAGESTGYGRRYVARAPTWIGLVPVGYGDGFRRDLTGTEVRVAGERRRVVGTVSMDSFAVELDRELPAGTPVVLLGHGILAEQHGAWRVALEDGRTVDFTPLRGTIEGDLATRDFTVNALARPLAGGEIVDPSGGLEDVELRSLRAVTETIFEDDPLRLLRAVRLEGELGFRLAPLTEKLVREQAHLAARPAGERMLAELERLSPVGFRRLDELGLLAPLGGSLARADLLEAFDSPDFRLVAVFGPELRRYPISNERKRFLRKLLRAERPA